MSTTSHLLSELTAVPRMAVSFPLELPIPEGFEPSRPESWPRVGGRIEFVGGRLEYMPPCGEFQQRTAADVVTVLNLWRRGQPGFIVGGNEAGMILGGEVRGADAAVWKSDGRQPSRGFADRPPVLAVEVAGRDDGVELLRAKARWYLDRGVEVVWLLEPDRLSVEIVTPAETKVQGLDGRIPPHPSLPGLSPHVRELFEQVASP